MWWAMTSRIPSGARQFQADMIAFSREVPFHLALKKTFEKFGCEGWGVAFGGPPNPRVSGSSTDRWLDANTLETHYVTKTPFGELTSAGRATRDEPGWSIERPIKDLARDLPAWECASLGGVPEEMDPTHLMKAWNEVGEGGYLAPTKGDPEGAYLKAVKQVLDRTGSAIPTMRPAAPNA